MNVLSEMNRYGHDQVLFCTDPSVGLKAIIAIHDTTLGPALGGCRMWPFASEEEALTDVLRLSQGMTYKASLAGLKLGGGKSVIIGDARREKSEALFRRFGRFVESLGGRYITAEDVGTTVQDMDHVARETRHVTGTGETHGGSGNPSPFTALGVFSGMKASAKTAFGSDDLSGKRVAVQGAGNVGQFLIGHLHEAGAKLAVCDTNQERLDAVKKKVPEAEIVPIDEIYDVDCDIFAPCALGAILNKETIGRLKCRVVAGAANNQLATEEDGKRLADREILYAPDFAINAGGLIDVCTELGHYNEEQAREQTLKIHDTLLRIFDYCKKNDTLPHASAVRLAEERIEAEKSKSAPKAAAQ